MKPYVIIGLLTVALTLSACGTELENGKDGGPTDQFSNNADVKNNSNQLDQVALPPVNINNSSSTVEQPSATSSATFDATRVLSGQEDLLKKYSSAIIKTSEGNVTIKFYSETPLTVNNFMNLAKKGFYNGTKFHRIMKDFMIQGGDPLTKKDDASVYGTGGPGYAFKNENGQHKLVAGNIAMANAGVNTNGSQFFIVTAVATPSLDEDYTNFGEVAKGMDIVRKIENSPVTESARGELSVPVNYITVNSVELVK